MVSVPSRVTAKPPMPFGVLEMVTLPAAPTCVGVQEPFQVITVVGGGTGRHSTEPRVRVSEDRIPQPYPEPSIEPPPASRAMSHAPMTLQTALWLACASATVSSEVPAGQ